MTPIGLLKGLCRSLGLEVHRYSANASPTAQIVSALEHYAVDLVFDIGANEGQFAAQILNGGFSGEIVSFEPLSQAHRVLEERSRNDKRWKVYPRCALGDRNGEIEINVSGNSVSSSILPMLKSHKDAAPSSAYLGKEIVSIKTFDLVATEYLSKAKCPFLKIDTQGFEWQVLDGAKEVLPLVQGILMELTLEPLYDGQHLWRETIDRLDDDGFCLWALQPGFTDPVTGRTLQTDGIFFRRP